MAPRLRSATSAASAWHHPGAKQRPLRRNRTRSLREPGLPVMTVCRALSGNTSFDFSVSNAFTPAGLFGDRHPKHPYAHALRAIDRDSAFGDGNESSTYISRRSGP